MIATKETLHRYPFGYYVLLLGTPVSETSSETMRTGQAELTHTRTSKPTGFLPPPTPTKSLGPPNHPPNRPCYSFHSLAAKAELSQVTDL